jgi:hypothetical protein
MMADEEFILAVNSFELMALSEGGPEALDEAMALWNSSGVEAYTFEFQRLCYCTEEYRAPYVTTVESGAVVAVAYVNATMLEPENELFQAAYTVEGLFAMIQSALDKGAYSVVVEYNETYGFPESIYIDYNVMMADEEFSLVVNAFELLEAAKGGQDSETVGKVSSISPSVAPGSSSTATPSAPTPGTRDSALVPSSATTLLGSRMIFAHLGTTMLLLSGLLVTIE